MNKRILATAVVFGTAAVLGIAAFAALSGGSSPAGVPRNAKADDPVDESYGFIDQANGGALLAQWNSLHAEAGKLQLGVPGVGILRTTTTNGTLSTNSDGSHHLAFSGTGSLDSSATLDQSLGYTFHGSGSSAARSFVVSADASADYKSASWDVTVDSVLHSFTADTPTHDADDTIDAALTAVHDKDWSGLWDLLSVGSQDSYPESQFASDLGAAFPSGTSLDSWAILPVTHYQGEPGPGMHTATALVWLKLTTPGGDQYDASNVELILDAGDWRVQSLGLMAEPMSVVTGTMHGWSFVQDSSSASGSLVSGPGTPLAGSGSARLQTSSSGGVEHIGTSAFAGTKLFSIDALSYSTYVATGSSSTNQAPTLRFDVDYDLTDTDTSDQGQLVYEPHFTETVSKGSWQTWDPLDGKWWATDTPGSDSCPESDPCAWDQVIAAFPHAGIPGASGEVQLSVGGGWPSGFDGNVDRFVIVIDGTANAFDFEP